MRLLRSQIPVLSTKCPPETYPHRSLVRFRGMVQDTSPSTEMYLYKSHDGKVGGWGIERQVDDAELLQEVDYACLRESTILWVTSIPGESPWYSEYLEGPSTESGKPILVSWDSTFSNRYRCKEYTNKNRTYEAA